MTAVEMRPRPAHAEPWLNRDTKHVSVGVAAVIFPLIASFLISKATGWPGVVVLGIYFLLQLIAASIGAAVTRGGRGIADSQLTVVILFATGIVATALGSVLYSVVTNGKAALQPHFIYENNVYVTTTTSLQYGGVGHAILGSVVMVGATTLVTVPIAVAVAVYLTESTGRLRGPVQFFAQALSGLPSVVSGLFIYSVFVATGLARPSGWLGAAALMFLMLPTVIRMSVEVLKLVPADLRSAALALGAPRKNAFFQVILPAAKSGIITAVLLGVARVVGETAPLLLTTRITANTNANIFAGDITTLPTYMFSFLTAGYDTGRARAWGAAFVLLITVGILFALVRKFSGNEVKK